MEIICNDVGDEDNLKKVFGDAEAKLLLFAGHVLCYHVQRRLYDEPGRISQDTIAETIAIIKMDYNIAF